MVRHLKIGQEMKKFGPFIPELKTIVKPLILTLKRTKNVRFLTLESWHGDHCAAFFILPQIMVRHLKIGPETKKLEAFIPQT